VLTSAGWSAIWNQNIDHEKMSVSMPQQTSRPPSANGEDTRPPGPAPSRARRSFLASRWRGEAPLGAVFWRDMILVGTALNIAATLATVLLLAADAPTPLALLIYFAPLPWSIFLFVSVWRCAERAGGPDAMTAKIGAMIWLMVMIAL
jgi:hypothetical protein